MNKDIALVIEIDNCKHGDECETCIVPKLLINCKTTIFRATLATEVLNIDLYGPMQSPTVGGKHYFLTFDDVYSRFTVICMLKNKYEDF